MNNVYNQGHKLKKVHINSCDPESTLSSVHLKIRANPWKKEIPLRNGMIICSTESVKLLTCVSLFCIYKLTILVIYALRWKGILEILAVATMILTNTIIIMIIIIIVTTIIITTITTMAKAIRRRVVTSCTFQRITLPPETPSPKLRGACVNEDWIFEALRYQFFLACMAPKMKVP